MEVRMDKKDSSSFKTKFTKWPDETPMMIVIGVPPSSLSTFFNKDELGFSLGGERDYCPDRKSFCFSY